MTGSEFLKQVWDVRIPMLSKLGLNEMLKGNMPSFLDDRIACHTEAVIDGGYYRLTYYVKPNYLAIGTDEDYVLWPLSIIDLQNFCNAQMVTSVSDPNDQTPKWFIATKKLVLNNWYASACKIPPQALGASADMTWPVKIQQEQKQINEQMLKKGCKLTAFCRAKKAYISAPKMANDGSTGGPKTEGILHFTGWYGFEKIIPDERVVGSFNGMPVYGVQAGDETGNHEASYADYSHGCDVIYYDCDVNGMQFTFDELCTHPKLHVLVSDEGMFNPRFPNVGTGVTPPKTTDRMPAPWGAGSDYKGPVFVSDATTGIVKMSAAGDPNAAAAAAAGGAVSKLPTVAIVAGLGALAIGAYFFFKKPTPAY